MKVSFLIPSKDRLGLLKRAIATIIDQNELGIEIVIADNASVQDYKSYVGDLKDPRVVYFRQPRPVSVTENWNQALSLSTGDYILMLGDDDALTPDFFSGVRQYLGENGPDVIYIAAYHYCYPNVIPGNPVGYLASVLNSEFFAGAKGSFNLDRKYAHELAQSMLAFHYRFGANAQHFLLKASFIRQFSVVGGFYQSPYPDTFSAVATFTHAESILVIPKELVIIGISPKSFGAYYFSGRHDEGYRFLDNEQVNLSVRTSLQQVILPGDKNNTNWLVAVESAQRAFPSILTQQVDYSRYRALQMIVVLRDGYLHGRDSHLAELRAKLSESELLLFEALESVLKVAAKEQPQILQQVFESITAQLRQYEPATVTMIDIGVHDNIWDAYNWLKNNLHRPVTPTASAIQHPETSVTEDLPRIKASQQNFQPKRELNLSAFYKYARRLARSALLALPPVRRLYERAANDARSVGQLQAENALLRRQLHDKGEDYQIEPTPLVIAIRRGMQQFRIAPEQFDEFEFRSGDEINVEPSAAAAKLLRTPEGHYHIPIGPGIGLRVPPKMNFVSFRGFSVPEHLLALTGAGFESFDAIGKAHISNYSKFMGLAADMVFLEIGSGIGRDAFQLIDIISPAGRYIGIDVQRESIVWCQRNITRRYPNFEFHHFNAHHELHNPLATRSTTDFRIPLPDRSVDRIALGSVFTHIFADEVTHYMKEIARVLKLDGLTYATFFLYTDEAVAASRENKLTPYNLRFEHFYEEGCYINDAQYPTGAVAYTNEAMQKMIGQAGLKLARPYLKGMWSGYYPDGDDGQDVALLRI